MKVRPVLDCQIRQSKKSKFFVLYDSSIADRRYLLFHLHKTITVFTGLNANGSIRSWWYIGLLYVCNNIRNKEKLIRSMEAIC